MKYPGRKITEVDDLLPCVLADGWSNFTLYIRASGVSNVCSLKYPRGKIAEVDDPIPCVLADGLSRFTSNIRASGVSNVGSLKYPGVVRAQSDAAGSRDFDSLSLQRLRLFNNSKVSGLRKFEGFDTSEDSTL
jgi:hypothetical protein